MNEVKITGKICNLKHETLPSGKIFSTFGLSVWMAKKNNKDTYEFINCEMWDEHLVVTEGDKDITGKLKVASWLGKDGKKQSRITINVKSVEDSKRFENNDEAKGVDIFPDKDVEPYDDLDDSLPF